MRRFPSGRLVVADRPPVVVLAVAVATAAAKFTTVAIAPVTVIATAAIAVHPVAIFPVTSAITAAAATATDSVAVVAAAAAAAAAAATVAAGGVAVSGATVVATGAQSAADEREQLLHVFVELVGQAGDAGTVRRRARLADGVSQHVRFEVHRFGVTRRLYQRPPLLQQILILVVLLLLMLPVLVLVLMVVLLLVQLVLAVPVVLSIVRIGRRGGDVRRRFRPVRFDHFHWRTVRLPLFRRRHRNAAVVHARRCRSTFGMRRPTSPGAPQTITPRRRLLVVHFPTRLLSAVHGRNDVATTVVAAVVATTSVVAAAAAAADNDPVGRAMATQCTALKRRPRTTVVVVAAGCSVVGRACSIPDRLPITNAGTVGSDRCPRKSSRPRTVNGRFAFAAATAVRRVTR